jgi:hypothetical protein
LTAAIAGRPLNSLDARALTPVITAAELAWSVVAKTKIIEENLLIMLDF